MSFRIKRENSFPPQAQSFLDWSRHLFLIMGILVLSYVGFALLDAKLYQVYQTWRFEQAVKAMKPLIGTGEPLHLSTFSPSRVEASHRGLDARFGSPLGRIEIRTIGLAVMILEGTEEATLRRAVGHIRGTSLPGQQGNVGIAGHRDTFFRPLRKIRKNDEITLTTLDGSYRYRVDYTQVVEPEDTKVLDNSGEAVLTLVTCYPFHFVGSAPRRFVVRAHRVLEQVSNVDLRREPY